jgi:hypothetical protein
MTVSNSIIWGNTAPYASQILVGNSGGGTSIDISYCDIENPDENVAHEPGCVINWGEGNIDADPQFTMTAYLTSTSSFGGSYHLPEESPCIDAGDPTFVAGAGETDIDGEPRISGAKIDMGADELVVAIPAEVKITPKTLNLESEGNWITCVIRLPDGYDVADVNPDTIMLNEEVNRVWCKINQQAQTILVKFDRSEIQDMLSGVTENPVVLSVTGQLIDGTVFEGTDTITIVNKGD